MKRIFAPYAYGPGPRGGCWWDETAIAPDWPVFKGDERVDVAIVGAGFTGVTAALHLAQTGADVAVLEAGAPGWGASGRNGGFCCIGGSRTDSATLNRRFGPEQSAAYLEAEARAVSLVAGLLERHGIDADTHSHGETLLAHNRRSMSALRARAMHNPDLELAEAADLPGLGMGGPFHGALTTRVGFRLNPRKYLFGLARAATAAGARCFRDSPAERVEPTTGGYRVSTPHGPLRAETVLIATNGYSSEDVPPWLAGRYMPAQSTVLVTRPLSTAEREAQGWTSDQMAYDTRNLLHYFRLMPDGRFLFGMRGGLFASARAEAAARRRTRRDFETLFPAWAHVPSPHSWSGLVCLARDGLPYVGPVPDNPGLFAGLAYHGNGVAMGTYAGRLLADLALGRTPGLPYPVPMRRAMRRFPLGAARRLLMPPLYALLSLGDL